MRFALLNFSDPAQARPRKARSATGSPWMRRSSKRASTCTGPVSIRESTARTVSVRDGQASTEGGVA